MHACMHARPSLPAYLSMLHTSEGLHGDSKASYNGSAHPCLYTLFKFHIPVLCTAQQVLVVVYHAVIHKHSMQCNTYSAMHSCMTNVASTVVNGECNDDGDDFSSHTAPVGLPASSL